MPRIFFLATIPENIEFFVTDAPMKKTKTKKFSFATFPRTYYFKSVIHNSLNERLCIAMPQKVEHFTPVYQQQLNRNLF